MQWQHKETAAIVNANDAEREVNKSVKTTKLTESVGTWSVQFSHTVQKAISHLHSDFTRTTYRLSGMLLPCALTGHVIETSAKSKWEAILVDLDPLRIQKKHLFLHGKQLYLEFNYVDITFHN